MIQRDHLGETEACQPHEARAATPSRDIVDELNRRAVAPMQVLGDQQQRPALGVAIEHLAHLAQHAIRADARELSSQGVALFRGAEPRQLQQPGRRHGAQQGRDARCRCGTAPRGLREREGTARQYRSAPRIGRVRKRRRRGPRRNARSASSCRYPVRRRPRPPRACRCTHRSQALRSRESASARPMKGGAWRRADWRDARARRRRGGYRSRDGNEAIASPRHRFDEARADGHRHRAPPSVR